MTAYRDFVYADFQGYAYGYGWRFIDTRSAQLATSDRERLGGRHVQRCTTLWS
ncbi:hypothetical protein LCL99_16050 [Halomonas denitrificans]|uniref:hypothetical protein n=1 Tax=Halomonas TaxID=2745 RepID=UPI001A8E6E42|nr:MULTISPECIES: hypothetical protein [Halomonas]MBN8411812.1 hypothetical protein [Halomonas litopenaei]MBY5923677.1 hypothetical protein [Halomonas sp. DP4Y7-2]MBY5983130.1 hypothetical protein [Halomonas sp. DP5Y7-2]MBY6028868.1 hypothetical protein [Halomonas sp. DP8Y7-1]MBY6209556.1 hypothetical protein [Halomonas sp. DP3Y7-2]